MSDATLDPHLQTIKEPFLDELRMVPVEHRQAAGLYAYGAKIVLMDNEGLDLFHVLKSTYIHDHPEKDYYVIAATSFIGDK